MNKIIKNLSIVICIIWLVLFILIPAAMVIYKSFINSESQLSLSNYSMIISPLYLKVVLTSLKYASIVTIICILLCYPLAYIIANTKESTKSLLIAILIAPFWISTALRILSLKIIFNDNGIINQLISLISPSTKLNIMYTEIAVVIGLIYTTIPFTFLPIYDSISKLDKSIINASRDLGANMTTTFTKVIIPLTSRGILAGAVMTFIPCLGAFYIADAMGGSKHLLIGNLIRDALLVYPNFGFAAALSVVIIGITILIPLIILQLLKFLNKNLKGKIYG